MDSALDIVSVSPLIYSPYAHMISIAHARMISIAWSGHHN
jgi:hypothetical protein